MSYAFIFLSINYHLHPGCSIRNETTVSAIRELRMSRRALSLRNLNRKPCSNHAFKYMHKTIHALNLCLHGCETRSDFGFLFNIILPLIIRKMQVTILLPWLHQMCLLNASMQLKSSSLFTRISQTSFKCRRKKQEERETNDDLSIESIHLECMIRLRIILWLRNNVSYVWQLIFSPCALDLSRSCCKCK